MNGTIEAAVETQINTGWVLNTSYLVFLMMLGFAMLEAGFTRVKNAKNIVLKNFVEVCISALSFFLIGYGVAFGRSVSHNNGFIGTSAFGLAHTLTYANWMFGWSFCAVASTIASGSLAERTQFASYIFYTFTVSIWVYPVAAHWVWSPDGWMRHLGTVGVIDFAGGTVVHTLGGIVGLVGAIVVGPRLRRFSDEGKAMEIPGHSSVLSALGASILWFGWYGFNTGSTLGLSGNGAAIAERVAVVTTLSGAAGAMTAMMLERFFRSKIYHLGMVLNGALAGLVSSTSPCAVVQPWAAVIIGTAGAACMWLSSWMLERLKIDDPVDASAVHVFPGACGVFCSSLFADSELVTQVYGTTGVYGLFLGGGGEQVWVQLVGILAIAAWCTFWSCLIFLFLKRLKLLRTNNETELIGLDHKHGGTAYSGFELSSEKD